MKQLKYWFKSYYYKTFCNKNLWDFFELVSEKSVKCKLCDSPGTVVRYHGVTTMMKNHLTSHL